jgi:hypothetical protein
VALVLGGAEHARQTGRPLNRFITINWSLADVDDVHAAQSSFIKHMRDWLRARGHAVAYVWVIERGPIKGIHTHLLVHVPPKLVTTAAKLQRGWLKAAGAKARKSVIYTRAIGLSYSCGSSSVERVQAAYQHNLAALLEYVCKAADEQARLKFNITRAAQRCEVIGKRVGTSRNIGTLSIRHLRPRA